MGVERDTTNRLANPCNVNRWFIKIEKRTRGEGDQLNSGVIPLRFQTTRRVRVHKKYLLKLRLRRTVSVLQAFILFCVNCKGTPFQGERWNGRWDEEPSEDVMRDKIASGGIGVLGLGCSTLTAYSYVYCFVSEWFT